MAIPKEREKEELEALWSSGNISSRRFELLQEKGTSSCTWLTAIPVDDHVFFLHKGVFRDALALRYGWQLQHLPDRCACGDALSVDHAMACKIGGFLIYRHNEIRDFTADFLRKVCQDVEVEPQLQPLTTESLALRSARVAGGDRPDIRAKGLLTNAWNDIFIDVRVFHPRLTAQAVCRQQCQPCTSALRRKRNANLARECERLSLAPLPPLFALPRVGWELKLRLSTHAWPDSCPSGRTCLFISQ